MNHYIQINKVSTLQELSNYRASILDEFLDRGNSLNLCIKSLITSEFDSRKSICLTGAKRRMPHSYKKLDKQMVFDFQRGLEKLLKDRKNAINKFNHFLTGKYFTLYCEYEDLQELVDLSNADKHAAEAEELIKLTL